MSKEQARQSELKKMELCDSCDGIQRLPASQPYASQEVAPTARRSRLAPDKPGA